MEAAIWEDGSSCWPSLGGFAAVAMRTWEAVNVAGSLRFLPAFLGLAAAVSTKLAVFCDAARFGAPAASSEEVSIVAEQLELGMAQKKEVER